jgi:uroporphyrinogen decarboxylase
VTDANSDFLRACRRQRVERIPVWFMRQAGRSLPEYRALRGTGSILSAVRDPELAAEITCQPVRRYGVDAAILFSDIMVPLAASGFAVRIESGVGPVIDDPIRRPADLDRLPPFDPDEAPYVAETIRRVVATLSVPLIGFAGAPFTLASYLVEGRPSRDHARTKGLMHADPVTWFALADRLADIATASLISQVEAGASAVQIFDSWAGSLSPGDYQRFALPSTKRILAALERFAVPRILFGVGTGELLDLMAEAGPDVVGVDWRVPLDRAARRIGPDKAVQGNLDPALCLAGYQPAAEAALQVIDAGRAAPGHVFNLGHGVLPGTDPGVLERLVELVHAAPVTADAAVP